MVSLEDGIGSGFEQSRAVLDNWGDVPGPETQPELDPSLSDEEKIALYKADASACMPKLKDIAVFILREAREDYETVTSDFNHSLSMSSYDPGDLKKDDRIVKKATVEKRGKDGEPRFDDIRDYGRSRVFGQTPDECAAVCEVVNWASYADGRKLPHNALVIDIDDRFSNPTPSGYRSYKATLAIPLDESESERPYHIVELQVQHHGFEMEIKFHPAKNRFHQDSHDAYKNVRTMNERFKQGDCTWDTALAKHLGAYIRTCQAIHQSAAEHSGLDRYDPDKFLKRRLEMALNEAAPPPKDLSHN